MKEISWGDAVVGGLYARLTLLEVRLRKIERDLAEVGATRLAEHILAQNSVDANGGWDFLSERERQIVLMVADGTMNKEIAFILKLSPQTVKNHMSHIHSKLGLENRTQLTAYAFRHGWVE